LAGAAAPAAADPGNELRVFSLEPASLLPWDAGDETSTLVVKQLYSGLVDYDLAGDPVLDLTASIESDDNLLWVIQVKTGYRFHDGESVDAEPFIRAGTSPRTGRTTRRRRPCWSGSSASSRRRIRRTRSTSWPAWGWSTIRPSPWS
jgi:hypothetical protein